MKVAIIDYKSGNVQSVKFALQRMGVEAELTADHDYIMRADKVIFPGVGEASTTMKVLAERGLDKLIKRLHQPVLGICLGMQLLCRHSEENNTKCLDIFPMEVKRFNAGDSPLKVPHMGWNIIYNLGDALGQKMEKEYMYFVHSYYVEMSEYTIGTCDYIHPFSAIIQKDNFMATQFHPEKSGAVGQLLLDKFLSQ